MIGYWHKAGRLEDRLIVAVLKIRLDTIGSGLFLADVRVLSDGDTYYPKGMQITTDPRSTYISGRSVQDWGKMFCRRLGVSPGHVESHRKYAALQSVVADKCLQWVKRTDELFTEQGSKLDFEEMQL